MFISEGENNPSRMFHLRRRTKSQQNCPSQKVNKIPVECSISEGEQNPSRMFHLSPNILI
ncbi:hypothetical protein ACJMK2_006215, partial [Sinanodonta woodiana]